MVSSYSKSSTSASSVARADASPADWSCPATRPASTAISWAVAALFSIRSASSIRPTPGSAAVSAAAPLSQSSDEADSEAIASHAPAAP